MTYPTTASPGTPGARTRWIRWLVWIGVAVGVLWVLLRLFSGVRIPDRSVLVMDLAGAYPDVVQPALPAWLVGRAVREPTTLPGLIAQLEKAARDDRLHAVAFRIRDLGIGWGKAQEIRAAIGALHAAGRPTAAYLEVEGFGSSVEYFVASAASRVYLPPGASPPLVGMTSSHLFLGGLWEKLGVQLEMERVGVYKSVGEQIAAESMSEAYREMAQSLLASVWSQFRRGVEETRELPRGAIDAVLADPAMPLARLVDLGLIDGVKTFPEILDDLAADRPGPRVSGARYAEVDPAQAGFAPVARIAVVHASGPIVLGRAPALPGSPVATADSIGAAVRKAGADPDIRAIVLRVDSPGGSALASELIWQAVREAARRKPVIASLSDVAASGGYYIASAAHRIVSDPATLTGSIGVVTLHPSIAGGLAKLGIGAELLEIGPHARLTQNLMPLSPATEQVQQRSVDRVYERFVARVAEGRALTPEEVDALARGRVWSGAQAHERGLVDRLGGFREALAEAKRAAGIEPGADVLEVPYPEPASWLEHWLAPGSDVGRGPLQAELHAALLELPASHPLRGALLPSMFPMRTPLLLAPVPSSFE